MVKMLSLKRRSDFLLASRVGRKGVSSTLILQHRDRGDDLPPRVGFTATKKIGNAPQRNRAKRRLRELSRLYLSSIAARGSDYVLIARYNTAAADWATLTRDLQRAVERCRP